MTRARRVTGLRRFFTLFSASLIYPALLFFNRFYSLLPSAWCATAHTCFAVPYKLGFMKSNEAKKNNQEFSAFQLPVLAYPMDGLEPHLSRETMEYHYGKHHDKYIKTLNQMLSGTANAELSLEELMNTADGKLYNNAAQVWNHNFYWNCLSPAGGGEPQGLLAEAIKKHFGSFHVFKGTFYQAAMAHFGSGWLWLVQNEKGKLQIQSTANAVNPLRKKQLPLLTCDLWEHAYYIDYRHDRANYIDAFWNIVNWDFVEQQFDNEIEK